MDPRASEGSEGSIPLRFRHGLALRRAGHHAIEQFATARKRLLVRFAKHAAAIASSSSSWSSLITDSRSTGHAGIHAEASDGERSA